MAFTEPQTRNDGESGYQYSPLSREHPQIRLVTLNAGSWSDQVECTVQVVSFDDQLVFEALSYVWGNPKVVKEIHLNGHKVNITENLWLAMRRLRDQLTPRVIWIDAICINQKDDDEKSQQVAMMGEIYKRCKKCTIWLGESSDSPEIGVPSTIATRACEILDILAADKHLPDLPCFSAVEGQRTNISERYEAHFEALRQLFDLPWWRRIWVIQELVLPPSVKFLYASEEFSYQTLRGVVGMLKSHATTCCMPHRMTLRALAFDPLLTIQERADPLVSTRETWANSESISLSQLRREFYAFQATEKRDLFYGLLGIVTEWGSGKPLQPNYSVPTRKAITEAVFKCTSEQGGMEFLLGERLFHTLDQQDAPVLPSWVPDACFCSVPPQWVAVEQRRLKMYSTFAASGSRVQTTSELAIGENESLIVQTFAVDRIAHVGNVCDALENWTDAPDIFRQWMEMLQLGLRDWPEDPPTEGSLMDVFWRTVISNSVEADTEDLAYRKPTREDYSQLRSLWLLVLQPMILEMFKLSFTVESHDALLSKAPKMIYHLLACLWQRRLFVTEQNRIGLAPRDASIGDEVHIVLGAPVPFILRHIEEPAKEGARTDAGPSYIVIGNSYFHDVMDGGWIRNRGQDVAKTIIIN
ncbi:heterokaryon incompatibility protein-domain-containing protein [Xylaria sp. FL0043]|nr:heterokaryon incompatibility protein-domain-containing protein [Xylaria sp. FL0043]